MSYVITKSESGTNYNFQDDRDAQLLFVSPSKKKAEAKLVELTERLSLTTELWQEIYREISLWERANPSPKGRPMREEWAAWREKHSAFMTEKCAVVERKHDLPEGWMLETANALEYRIVEVEDL